jgi:hypothetical protein
MAIDTTPARKALSLIIGGFHQGGEAVLIYAEAVIMPHRIPELPLGARGVLSERVAVWPAQILLGVVAAPRNVQTYLI